LRKIIGILIIGIFINGCAVTRKMGNEENVNANKLGSGNIIKGVEGQNITNNNFFIKKAEIEVVTKEGKEKLLGNIKFQKPDKYLISIKGRSGIEGARIYISGDTILINDRINKKLYLGTSFYLERKYGLTLGYLPLIFGDIVLDKNSNKNMEECQGEKLNINSIMKGIILNYEISCKERKTILVNQINNFNQKVFKIENRGFFKSGEILIPRITEYEDYQHNTKVMIKILKVELQWEGNIKFYPGKGYELIELV
jgi:hypothetical protein